MSQTVFPNAVFAWAFCGLLLGFLAVAAYQDHTRMLVPKWVTIPALALGLLLNGVRGAWVAEAVGGVLDGLLFALEGFAVGFGLFLVMWLLNTCGGGDVKLFAALGAWVGPLLTFYVLCATIVLVAALAMSHLGVTVLRGRPLSIAPRPAAGKPGGKRKRRLMTYSLPAAISTACVLLWVFRAELQLAPPQPETPDQVRAAVQK